jgi:glycerophosphoryl diester phosphodiesterase
MCGSIRYAALGLITAAVANAHPPKAAPPKALVHAHAHNDYNHQRPLLDALERGFTSIEADVFLVNGELLVGHDKEELRPERTLDRLYLAPLEKHVRANGGRVFEGDQRLLLLIDFKSDGPAAYAALTKLLAARNRLYSEMKGGKFVPRAVDVVITGNRPVKEIAADSARRVVVDGRLDDLRADVSKDLIPLVSENWFAHFTWRGDGEMPADQQQRLRELAEKVHAGGRRLRFWGAPDNEKIWSAQLDAGVDLVNTDDLDGLKRFLVERGR